MNINSIPALNSAQGIEGIKQVSTNFFTKDANPLVDRNQTFESMFQSAMSMIEETNQYSNQAKEAEMAYAMGIMTSTHDLQIAQQKANVSLQYTVAVRNAVLDAYKEIMQLQF